jgi:starch synthase
VLRDVIRLKEVHININGEERVACVKSSFIPDSKVQIYFVEIPGFFVEKSFLDSKGNPRKEALKELAFFSKAVMELLKILCWYPNLIHTNDWQSGLVYYYLQKDYNKDPEYKGLKTVHSIHNLQSFGIFKPEQFKALNIDAKFFTENSLLKTAIAHTDVLTLNNEEALMEYEEDAFYKLSKTKKNLEIIPHGYDDLLWNPQAKKMKQVYTNETIEQKESNKKYLTHKKDLDLPENCPIILMHLEADFDYLMDLKKWLKRQEKKNVYIVLTSVEKDINKLYKDEEYWTTNAVFLKAVTNDEMKNYLAASDFYINLCNRSYYNQRFAISVPFGTIVAGERSKILDQFMSVDEDDENFNAVLVTDIKKDFDKLIDKILHVFQNNKMIDVQKRIMTMLISWNPSGMRIGKIYDRLCH